MIRRLFNIIAAVSLVLLIFCFIVAVWSQSNTDMHAVARHRHFWGIGTSRGVVTLISMPWPRDEPRVVIDREWSNVGFLPGYRVRNEYVFVRWTGTGITIPGGPDPWDQPAPTNPRPVLMSVTMIRPWLLVDLLGVAPAIWVVLRLLLRRRVVRGFDVEPVGQ